MRLDRIVAGASLLAASALFMAACAGQAGLLNPLSASGVGASVQALEGGTGSCSDGIDNDDNKLTRLLLFQAARPITACKTGGGCPAPRVGGEHVDVFNTTCGQVQGWTCSSLWYAITCKGSQAGCTGENRQAARIRA